MSSVERDVETYIAPQVKSYLTGAVGIGAMMALHTHGRRVPVLWQQLLQPHTVRVAVTVAISWYLFGYFVWAVLEYRDHGVGVCGDYEGSWSLGFARGPAPHRLAVPAQPPSPVLMPTPGAKPAVQRDRPAGLGALSCLDVSATSISFLADPFLVGVMESGGTSLPAEHLDTADAIYVLYEQKSRVTLKGQIGGARSEDGGRSWQVLDQPVMVQNFHLSYPLTVYHSETQQWLMFPAPTQDVRDLLIFGTPASEFPFGWRVVHKPLASTTHADVTPVFVDGLWYIFMLGPWSAGQVWVTSDLLGEWKEHPRSPVRNAPQAVRPGGRPVVIRDADGRSKVVRFVQENSQGMYGRAVVVLEATVSPTEYSEVEIGRYEPTEREGDWNAYRMHHVDPHLLSDGSWVAVMDGDSKPDLIAADGIYHTAKRWVQWGILIAGILTVIRKVRAGQRPYRAGSAALDRV